MSNNNTSIVTALAALFGVTLVGIGGVLLFLLFWLIGLAIGGVLFGTVLWFLVDIVLLSWVGATWFAPLGWLVWFAIGCGLTVLKGLLS